LDYFSHKEHQLVSSSSLVPGNDPTLLFTNAGMVQFKDVFLGKEQRKYIKATSSQRCVRAGGKHNDLENVGYTARHHTFFEMLGNFSFGDYFKKDAIHYAWEFLTQVVGLPEERLWVTVYEKDDEAADIWLNEVKVSSERFSRIGEKDNFWSMGETGPCGPCSEIFYDHGESIPGGPPGSPDEDGDRYIEIWNLVFMQYNRDKSGKLTPLPKPSVDTGMGLERLAAILQDVHNNYDIDLFQALIKATAKLASTSDLENKSLRVIADHIRACAFLIVDGVIPSNEGRGYVLRRIIRRAIRHGHQLGIREAFFHKLVSALETQMGTAYPELTKNKSQVEKVLLQEEIKFAETLEKGMEILESEISQLKDKVIPGKVAFKLYDTYGFPVDLTADIAREQHLSLDMDGFDVAMEAQRQRARSAGAFDLDYNEQLEFSAQTQKQTAFCGYEHLFEQCKITDIFVDGKAVQEISAGQQGIIVLNETPFYAESGGQEGDNGLLSSSGSTFDSLFDITDTQKQADIFIHIGKVSSGSFSVNSFVEAQVNKKQRQKTAANHSATHLLHAALRNLLGDHVQQKGSMVNDERLRFDFSHFEAVNNEQLHEIERMVNSHIRLNHPVETRTMSVEDAKSSGAMALFGEKYADEVRVLSMSSFSVELCGGTHVNRTGDIGLFKIISESGVAAGVRRIEAVSSEGALDWVEENENQIEQLAKILKSPKDSLDKKLLNVLDTNRLLEKELERLKSKLASNQGSDLVSQAVDVNGVKVLAIKLDAVDAKTLRETMDQLKNKLGTCIIVLGTSDGKKVSLIAGVSKDAISKIKAGDAVNHVAAQVGGKGGGRPDMAMAGGSEPENLDKALASFVPWIKTKLD